MTRLGVSARLMLLILVAALPVFLLYIWHALDQRRDLQHDAQDQLLRSARLLAAQQDQYFLRASNLMSTALLAAQEIGVADPACSILLASVAGGDDTFTALSVADADGTVLCSSQPDALGTALGDRSEVVEALATGGFAVGAPRTGEYSGRQILPLAFALTTAEGGRSLVAVANLDLAGLSDTLAQSTLPAGGVGVIFNAGRSILARVPASAAIDDAVFAPVRADVAVESGGVGLVESDPVNGVRQIWAVADLLADQGLFVAIGTPVPALVSAADRNLWRGLAILLAVFAVAAAAAWLVGEGTIRRPLASLAGTAGALRRGDLSARLDGTQSAPELRNLAESFNAMASAIQGNAAELQHRNDRLNQLIGEKEMLVREMNHRIKNSLQLVSSMVGLQLASVSDPDARARLSDAQTRVAAVAKVHERLYAGQRLDSVEVGRYLADLGKDLAETMGIVERGGAVTVRSVDQNLAPDKVIPLGLIASELVTNAVKHSASGAAPHIDVSLEADAGQLRLSVADNGPGLPAGFDPGTNAGLGMKVIRALALQLGGRLEIEQPERGTRFSVRFPAEG